MIFMIPLIGLVVLAYNVIAIVDPALMAKTLVSINLVSGGVYALTSGTMLVVLALLLLYVELITSVRARSAAIVNHALSVVLLLICVVEFLIVRACATDVFLYLTLITFVDVIAGLTVSISSARRDVSLERGIGL